MPGDIGSETLWSGCLRQIEGEPHTQFVPFVFFATQPMVPLHRFWASMLVSRLCCKKKADLLWLAEKKTKESQP